MNEYKRLTTNENGVYDTDCRNCPKYCTGCNIDDDYSDCFFVVEQRLAELEDKIEQGLLIKLPCKVGDTVYQLNYEKDEPCDYCNHDYSGFGETNCDLGYSEYPQVEKYLAGEKICPQFQMTVWDIKFSLSFYESYKKWFNITWFLSKAEAKAKLAELKGEQK